MVALDLKTRHYLKVRRMTLGDHIRRIQFQRETLDHYLENFFKDVREWHGPTEEGKLSAEEIAECTGLDLEMVHEILNGDAGGEVPPM